MRGFTTDAYTGDSPNVVHERPLSTDVTYAERAANRRRALFESALGERVPYLETDFRHGIAQTVRRLTADQAGRLIVEDAAYFCQECQNVDGRITLHIPVGKGLDDVERIIGSGENVAGKPRE